MNEPLSHCITVIITAAVAAIVRFFEKRNNAKKQN